MAVARAPRFDLAPKVLPAALHRALLHVFAQKLDGCMLVGGTALAGFYLGHRRSDDLDLFTRDAYAFRAAVLATRSLASQGATLLKTAVESAQYFHAAWEFQSHRFTTDIVLDSHLFEVGSSVLGPNGVVVADWDTLFKTKAATLVSRCSEKDLYDLIALFREHDGGLAELISAGSQMDAGVNAENLLLSVGGAHLAETACAFSLEGGPDAGVIYGEIREFRRTLVRALQKHLKGEPASALAQLIQPLRKLAGR